MTVTILVPSARDMDQETYWLHIRLRHESLICSGRTSRREHETTHRCSPEGWHDHDHREPVAEPARKRPYWADGYGAGASEV